MEVARRNHLLQLIHALWIHSPAIIPLHLPRKNRLKLQTLEVKHYRFSPLTLMAFLNSPYAKSLPSNKSCWDSPLANRQDATGLVMLLEKWQLRAEVWTEILCQMIIPSYCRERAYGSMEISSWSFHVSGTKAFLLPRFPLIQTIQHRLRSEEQILFLLQ